MLTEGCSSCTNKAAPVYPSSKTCGAADSTAAQCFGLTPKQEREIGFAFLVAGGIMLIFPIGFYKLVISPMISKGKGSKRDAGLDEPLNKQQPGGYPAAQPIPQAQPVPQAYPSAPAMPQAQVSHAVAHDAV